MKENNGKIMKGFLEAVEGISKVIGLAGIIAAAVMFSSGDKLLSSLSVGVTYVGFRIFYCMSSW
jgi:hypothetical protein